MTTAETIDFFLRYCAEHRAKTTVRFYLYRLKKLREKFGEKPFKELTPLDAFEYLHAAGEGKSDSTKRHNAVALESLQSFAIDQKLIPARLFAPLEKPRIGVREQLLTEEQIGLLLAKSSPAFTLIYTALRQCGARPGELCSLQISDINRTSKSPCIEIKKHKTARKTGKPRKIPLGKKLAELIATAIGDRTAGPVFLNRSGQPWTSANLTQTFSRYRKAAGLPAGLVLYLARHEFGTKLCKAKGIKFASDLLGHSNTRTTERYVHLDDEDLRNAQDEV